jgi:arsenite/tail-anchored protein-transporting ATPase
LTQKNVTMFGGKGGVGKTTCAGATALHYANEGLNTLIISTDPTPSLFDIFEMNDHNKPAKVTNNLHLAELGTEEVKEMWNNKFGHEVYEVFSSMVSIEYDEFVDFITSILPGLQEEFMVNYIRELALSGTYDRIVWDTAPLGQTMHLINMPEMLRNHLKPAPKIYSRLKLGSISKRSILKVLEDWSEISAQDMQFLKQDVQFTMVTIPEALAVHQLDGIFAEFATHDFKFSQIIINNIIETNDSDFLRTKREQQQGYIKRIHSICDGMQVIEVPLFPHEIKGLQGVAEISKVLFR